MDGDAYKNLDYLECGYGFINDKTLLRYSTSGGFARAVYDSFLDNGAAVYGVAYTKDYKSAIFKRIVKKSDLDSIVGTKYVYAQKKLESGENVFKSVCNDLVTGLKVLFIGLPCEIAALKTVVRRNSVDDTSLYCIDLFCHGTINSEYHQLNIDQLEKHYHSSITTFNVRYKYNGWKLPYLLVEFENGKKYLRLFGDTDYGTTFRIASREPCYKCIYKGNNHQSDISIGDFWGVSQSDIGYNRLGVSSIIVRNSKGAEIIKVVRGFNYYPAPIEKVLANNDLYLVPCKKNELYERFTTIVKEKGIKAACWSCISNVDKIRRIIPIEKIKKLKK